jgi:hypothetical protein
MAQVSENDDISIFSLSFTILEFVGVSCPYEGAEEFHFLGSMN